MLSSEAAVGAAFLKHGVRLPWAHRSLPCSGRPLCHFSPSPRFPGALILLLPNSPCCPLANHMPCTLPSRSLPLPSPHPGEPLLIAADILAGRSYFQVTSAWTYLDSRAMSWAGRTILPPTLLCIMIWVCTPIGWDVGGASPHSWYPTCYLYSGDPLPGSPFFRIGSGGFIRS